MSSQLIIRKIDGSVEQLRQRACLRVQDDAKLSTITNPTRQKEWLMSKVIAWEERGLRIDYSDNGAPTVEGGYISISHGGGYVALLFSDKPCGVDIEPISRNAGRLSRKFATPHELDITTSAFAQNPALLIWCAKEALYKRVGVPDTDFIADLNILSTHPETLIATAFGAEFEMQYRLQNDILVVTI